MADSVPPAKRRKTSFSSSPAAVIALGSTATAPSTAAPQENTDLYLETVHRERLQPDAARLCSVTLADTNIYACLSCGDYLQGRGKSTPAFVHALESGHKLFLRVSDTSTFVLPEGTPCTSRLLSDVKQAFNPTFSKEAIAKLDETALTLPRDITKKTYFPGMPSIHRLGESGVLSTTLHALTQIMPIRNFLLQLPHDRERYQQLPACIQALSLLVRKVWSSSLLRSHLSAVQVGEQLEAATQGRSAKVSEPGTLLAIVLDTLHRNLGGTRTKPITTTLNGSAQANIAATLPRPTRPSLVTDTCQGILLIESQAVRTIMDDTGTDNRLRFEPDTVIVASRTPFTILTLTLPPIPLFAETARDGRGNILDAAAVTVESLLARYNGSSIHDVGGDRKRYSLLALPEETLALHLPRAVPGAFEKRRNRTAVQIPFMLDMTPWLHATSTSLAEDHLFDLFCVIASDAETGEFFAYTRQRRTKGARWFKWTGQGCVEVSMSELSVGEASLLLLERRHI